VSTDSAATALAERKTAGRRVDWRSTTGPSDALAEIGDITRLTRHAVSPCPLPETAWQASKSRLRPPRAAAYRKAVVRIQHNPVIRGHHEA
jgi:hypothetical protein